MSFTLKETVQLTDIHSIGYVYEHDKTKSKVAYIANDDTNKSFAISFATPPYNDNGIAHIIEHSVLCGSRKYPVKEPFVELAKGSLNTFLNALTFADKTMYPIASTNAKDFKHLMDVYLDAVFFPNMLQDENILRQEGWHYHLENSTDELTYKGVVYNEMKGAFSNPDEVIYRQTSAALFPDTVYAHESGGTPLAIPTLSFDEFVDFHQTYYHPSNAYTVLYGDLDINDALAHLDTYFSQFDEKVFEQFSHIQTPFEQMQSLQLEYAVDADESVKNKDILNVDFVVGTPFDETEAIYFDILNDVLVGSNASPIRKALLDAKLSTDISSGYSTEMPQGVFWITIKNTDKNLKTLFLNTVTQTIDTLIQTGLDDKLVTAAINRHKFSLTEAINQDGHYPKGIVYTMSIMKSWLYGQDTFSQLFFEAAFKRIEKDHSILIDLLKRIRHTTHALMTVATPKQDLNTQVFEEVHQKLQAYKATLSTDAITQLITQTQALQEKQDTPDSPEQLAKVPLLTREDLTKEARKLHLSVSNDNYATVLHHDVYTGGIDYVSFKFDLSHLTLEQLPYASFILQIFKQLSTTHYSLDDLTTSIDSYTGGITFDISTMTPAHSQMPTPYAIVKGKAFTNQVGTLLSLVQELMIHTQFDQRDKLKEQLSKLKARYERRFQSSAHMTAVQRLRTYYNADVAIDEQLTGIVFYEWLTHQLEHFDATYDTFITTLTTISQQLWQQHGAIIGFIGTSDDFRQKEPDLQAFLNHFPSKLGKRQNYDFDAIAKNEGLSLASDVQYVAQGHYMGTRDELSNISGHIKVLKNVLDYTYLWHNIRVKGGAYGSFVVYTTSGEFIICSYRDPNLDDTLNTYAQLSQYVSDLVLDERELLKLIIGTISDLDAPLSPQRAGELAFSRYQLGITPKHVQSEREQILQTTTLHLQQLAPLLNRVFSENNWCVVGSQKALKQSQKLKTIHQLMR